MKRGLFFSFALLAGALLAALPTTSGRAQDEGAEMPVPATRAPKIKPGDTLEISVFGHAELSRIVHVQPDGAISYPFIGRLVVTGSTVADISARIAEALDKGYAMRDPKVSVAIASYGERRVFVLGEVRSSGAHSLPVGRGLTVVQLIALAGGFDEDADPGRVRLHRERGGQRVVQSLDLREIARTGLVDSDAELEDGDTVIVPRSGEVSLLGQVNAPGTYILDPGKENTAVRVIAKAGGFTRLADRGDVTWIRTIGKKRRVAKLDVDDIIDGDAEDPEVAAGDVFYVPERIF